MPTRDPAPPPVTQWRPVARTPRPAAIAAVWLAFGAGWVVAGDVWLVDMAAIPSDVLFSAMAKDLLLVMAGAALLLLVTRRLNRRLGDLAARENEERAARTHLSRIHQAIADHSRTMLYVKDLQGRYLMFNRAAGRLVGQDPLGIIGRDDLTLFPEAVAAAARDFDQRVMREDRVIEFEEVMTTPQGSRYISVLRGPLHDENGGVIGVFGIGHDITEQRGAEEALRRAEKRHNALFENIIGGFGHHRVIFDQGRAVDFEFLRVNEEFTRLIGLDDVVGKRASEVFPGLHVQDADLLDIFFRVAESGRSERFERYIITSGKWLLFSVFQSETGTFSLIFDDITDRKVVQNTIEHLACHDTLTGLPNRVLAKDRMGVAAAHADRQHGKAALMFLDLDEFKGINNSLGHSLGDDLIRQVADRLCQSLRDTDTVSRQGGDEFLIVASGLPNDKAISTVAGKILARLAQPFALGDQSVMITGSIGIAVYPDDGHDFDTLLKKADTAVCHAKKIGRNTHRFFDQEMNAGLANILRIRNDLHRALDQDEFELYYQPQIDLASNRMVGAEALIRWIHPGLGLIPPDQFIPVAEESGLIGPIGDWVLETACHAAAGWPSALSVAVNLSPLQFSRGSVEQSVTGALARSGLDPTRLELELTESIMINDVDQVLATVRRLKSRGVRLAIDDFGTGYSSLSYLKRFTVDKLKIDRSFVRDLVTDPDDAAIIRTLIQMGHALNLRVIAEGVETEQMRDHLRIFCCDEAQGFLFARPLPAAAFIAFIETHAATTGDSSGDGAAPLPILSPPDHISPAPSCPV